MVVPKPDGWKDSFDVFGTTLTYDPDESNETSKAAVWHDPAFDFVFLYHYLDIAPDLGGERIEIVGGPQQFTYQRARVGWQVIPSGLPPEVLATAPAWDVGPEKFPTVRSSASEKFATDMRDALKGMMEADPYYFDIPIITERLQNIDAKVEGIVGKAGGLCIVLVTTTFAGPVVNLPGANFDTIVFVARVFENVKSNPTGKEAQHVALYTAALWSQLKPDTFDNSLKLDDPGVVLGNDPRFLTYDCTGVTNGGTKIEIPRLEALTIDASNLAAIALANAKPGAAIFYTLNGSYPAPRNPAALLYLATFNSAPGVTVRARAWLPGYIPSAELRVVL